MSTEFDREHFEFINRHAGKYVLIRTSRSGVHFGELVRTDGKGFVSLVRSRRIWQWKGAFTLTAVAQDGVDESETKLSRESDEMDLYDATENATCSDKVVTQLRNMRSWVPA